MHPTVLTSHIRLLPIIQKTLADNLRGKSAAAQMTELLNQYDGFTIGEHHDKAETKQVLLDNLEDLSRQGVKLLGIEHIRNGDFSKLLKEYYNQPPGTPMPKDLAVMLTALDKGITSSATLYGQGIKPKFFTQIVEKARQLGIQIVPLDTDNNGTPTDAVHRPEIRVAAMNMVGEKLLHDQRQLNPGAKYVLLVDGAHNNTHAGLTRGMPGLAQALGIPAVRVIIDKDDRNGNPISTGVGQVQLHLELDLEDPKKRRPATAAAPK
jgi:hypothetical protein